jgi:hypothetical protein
MQVKGLNGRTYNLKLVKRINSKCSKGHEFTRGLIQKLFPFDNVFEEVNLPGTNKLKLDFFIPAYKIAVEVHGRQHTEFVPFFQKHKANLMKAFQNDNNKRRWCELNEINLIELEYGKQESWESVIKSKTN